MEEALELASFNLWEPLDCSCNVFGYHGGNKFQMSKNGFKASPDVFTAETGWGLNHPSTCQELLLSNNVMMSKKDEKCKQSEKIIPESDRRKM